MMKEKILNALSFNKLAYDSVKNSFKRGMSETDIKEIILSACSAADDFSGDIIGGVRTASIEGDATDYILKNGDCLILDLQFKSNGVWTDTTRTFFIGQPSSDVQKAYKLCLISKKAGEQVLKNGVLACHIHNAVKTGFSPFEKNFPHHAGHVFGTSKLMQPQFLPDSKLPLHTNSFVTIEPGIYFENNFGVRVEDNYIITENGFQNLFNYPLELENFII